MVKCTLLPCLDSFHEKERQLFMDEISVMKRVSDGNNPHVLKMLGCVTTTSPMMLILQFVPHGNLKNYLRATMKALDGVRKNSNDSCIYCNWLNAKHCLGEQLSP